MDTADTKNNSRIHAIKYRKYFFCSSQMSDRQKSENSPKIYTPLMRAVEKLSLRQLKLWFKANEINFKSNTKKHELVEIAKKLVKMQPQVCHHTKPMTVNFHFYI